MTPDPDLGVLIHRARGSLAAASAMVTRDVELLIDGLDERDSASPPVLLLDCNGQPRFVCDRHSGVARAASLGRPALLRIQHAAPDDDPVAGLRPRTVSFAGQLERLADRERAAVACLTLAAVMVELVDGGRHQIPLSAYRAWEAVPA